MSTKILAAATAIYMALTTASMAHIPAECSKEMEALTEAMIKGLASSVALSQSNMTILPQIKPTLPSSEVLLLWAQSTKAHSDFIKASEAVTNAIGPAMECIGEAK